MAYIGSKPADKPVVASDLDPAVITGQTALAVAPASTDEFLISDAGVLKRLDASLIGGTNTPAFFASVTGDQTLSHDTFTKIAFSNEVFDVGGVYDNSTNYRFTPGFVGKSFIASTIFASDAESNLYAHSLYLYKNGSQLVYHQVETGSTGETFKQNIISLNGVFAHDADDYFEVFGEPYTSDSGTVHYPTGSGNDAIFRNSFYGFKIIE